ncbi:serine hydrolase [Candidatus Saganbacteria bacterium]|nr:serine hydrolase [Candidatus Saganbacteria bacterium]
MIKKISAILIIALLASPCNAITKAKINQLGIRLTKLAAPYQNKVGVCIIDLKTGLKLTINGKMLFPAASVAKVPVMAAAYHISEAGSIELSEKLLFTEKDKLGGSGVLQWMKGNREYTLKNLIRLMIVLSDNTATKMVIDRLGTNEVNSYIKNAGLNNTNIVDATCLNEKPNPDMNMTTPEDMAIMMVILQSNKFTKQSRNEMLDFMKKQRYRWGIWKGVPRGIVVADKTGNVEGVLNDVGIVYKKKGSYVISIFTNGFKKKRDARKIINKISEITYGFSN